ncbi:hypothetical protein DFS34DRAFT_214589 [Phlyctochytrium arcticum]|nr:hypothetical protein DFS34DRAFT_214589 [Phlyctochytrium arcticum]
MNVRQTPKFINTPAIFQVDDLLVRAWENKQTNGQRSHHRRITLSEYNALRKEVGRLGDELTRGGGDTAKLEQDEARLKDLTTQLEDQKRNVHFRITKLRRKKEWKKRRQEECKLKREEGIMRRKQLDEQTETWIQDRRLLDSLFEEDDLAVKELEQRINRQQASSEKEEGMDRLIRQLEELRALRRAKRKLAGICNQIMTFKIHCRLIYEKARRSRRKMQNSSTGYEKRKSVNYRKTRANHNSWNIRMGRDYGL